MPESRDWIFRFVAPLAIAIGCAAIGNPCTAQQNLQNTLSTIKLPKTNEFHEVTHEDEDELAQVGQSLLDLEAWFETENFDLCVRGDYGRTFTRKTGAGKTILNSLSFRISKDCDKGLRRIIRLEQSLLDNPNADLGVGVISDNARQVDFLFNDHEDHASLRIGRSRVTHTGKVDELAKMVPHQLIFHPFRASLTGVDQILNGHALRIGRHGLHRETIKRIARRGATLFLWVEISGPQTSVNQLVAFEDGCPVQIDQWGRIDEKSKSIIPYETVRTKWTMHESDVKLPAKIYGVRRHNVRPAEFFFECRWKIGKNVDSALFDPRTLGETAIWQE